MSDLIGVTLNLTLIYIFKKSFANLIIIIIAIICDLFLSPPELKK